MLLLTLYAHWVQASRLDVALDLYGDVILTRDVPARGLRAGDVATVVERHVVAGVSEEGYSVEFFDMTGNTVAVVTLPARALLLPTAADRPTVRALSALSYRPLAPSSLGRAPSSKTVDGEPN